MKTLTVNLYEFSELDKHIQEKVIQQNNDINFHSNWWEYIYLDAEEIGLKITGFELDNGNYCNGEFISNYYDTANLIIKNHGENCNTYKTAANFLKEYTLKSELVGDNDNPFNSGVSEIEHLQQQFLDDLLYDYLTILKTEYEYLTSDEAIIETIEANGYTFEANGTMRNI